MIRSRSGTARLRRVAVAVGTLALGGCVRAPAGGAVPPSAATTDDASARAARRGTVVADTFWSPALEARKRALVYLPPSYDREPARRYPVVYYLHGLWGAETDWTRHGRLDRAMDSLVAAGMPEMIVVMPDGDDGWYTTWREPRTREECARLKTGAEPVESYCVGRPRYDEYVARDVVAHVDSTFRTHADRRHRGIAGLSMGGLGAFNLALRFPERFSAAASHSGVLSPLYVGPRPFADRPAYASDERALEAAWGPRFWPLIAPAFGRDTAGWWANDPSRLARALVARGGPLPVLFADVGTDDELVIDGNRALHHELERLGVPHRYAEWPGAHSWDYWRAHVGESLRWLADRVAAGPVGPVGR